MVKLSRIATSQNLTLIAIVIVLIIIISAFVLVKRPQSEETGIQTTTSTPSEKTTTITETKETETTTITKVEEVTSPKEEKPEEKTPTTTKETTTRQEETIIQSETMTVQTTTPAKTTTPQETEEVPKKEVKLVILTRHPGDIIQKTKQLFLKSEIAKEYNIVDLQFISVPPGLWVRTAEAKQADVGWGGGPTLFDTLYIENMLAPLETEIVKQAVSQVPDTLAGVPLKKVGPDGEVYWVSAAVSSFGFTVNTELAQQYGLEIPKSWRDLASLNLAKILVSSLEPPLGIADPTTSTSNTRMYEIILQAYGWDEGWRVLTLMAANAHIYGGSGDVRDAVIRGERIVGITIDFYGYTAQLKNPACVYISPPGETIVNGDPIALLKTSQNPEAAQAFIAWVLTEGQKIWLDKDINRLPANPKVFETPEGKQRPDLKESYEKIREASSINFNDTLALSYEFMMQQFFKATLVDVHSKLQEAWMALVEAYLNGAISEEKFQELKKKLTEPIEFTDPTTGDKVTWSAEVAARLNKEFFAGNTSILDTLMKEWREAASAKYQSVLDELGG